MPKIFAIVLNYNGKQTLVACLKSLYQSDYPNLEIVLVDNNSTDGSLEKIKDLFQKIHIIKNSANIGFGPGNNVGIRFALEKFADYIFLLNNDAVVEKNTISLLTTEAEKNQNAGVLSPLILTKERGPTWYAGGKIIWSKMRSTHLFKPLSDKLAYETTYASGCALLIKKAVFQKIGLFDERFFLYYEDVDFSLRASKNGFGVFVLPTALAFHSEQSNQQNPFKTYWLVLSGILFFKKNTPSILRPWTAFYLGLRKIKNYFTLLFKKDPFAAQVHKAYIDSKHPQH